MRDSLLDEYISTHAPLAGRDGAIQHDLCRGIHFNPRAPCGARPKSPVTSTLDTRISTHAPLAGRDGVSVRHAAIPGAFQPTRPLRGATATKNKANKREQFQPTRPLRGATLHFAQTSNASEFQPTRPLRGATKMVGGVFSQSLDFNPRAPCGARL